jgi:hypothetical protein
LYWPYIFDDPWEYDLYLLQLFIRAVGSHTGSHIIINMMSMRCINQARTKNSLFMVDDGEQQHMGIRRILAISLLASGSSCCVAALARTRRRRVYKSEYIHGQRVHGRSPAKKVSSSSSPKLPFCGSSCHPSCTIA